MGTVAAPPQRSEHWLRAIARDRFVWLGLVVWAGFGIAIPPLAHGVNPFPQLWPASADFSTRVVGWSLGPVFALIIIALAFALTHHRSVEIAARVPERAVSLRETIGLLVYGAAVLIAGVFIGPALGFHRIGLHLTGSMFGLSGAAVRPQEVYLWSAYNFLFYALLPYWFFRRRGYSNQALCLKSSDVKNDTLVILCILGFGVWGDLPGNPIFTLSAHQFGLGGLLAFALSLFGTGLPIMIFLTCILVPRYKKLTNSTAATCVLGGFTYASLHLAEYWTRYDTPAHGALSVIFIVLLFGGPGMVKSYLTLRTGNAWVHLWGFHAIWPHVTEDTVTFVKIFGVR